jgi:ligand-binding sensor domain-containing protein
MQKIYSLLTLLLFLTACQGQENANTDPQDSTTAPMTTLASQPAWVDPGSLFQNNAQISEYIRRVFQDKNGNLWFGTNGDGVARYNGVELVYFGPSDGFCGSAVRGMVEDEKGNIWFGTDGGVCRYDGKTFTSFTKANGLNHNQVWSILIDRSGVLWVGTEGGVSRFNGKSFVPFSLPEIDLSDSPDAYPAPQVIWSIYQDKAGNIWFGTNGDGAYCYNGQKLRNLSEKDGLCNNVVQCILEDRTGNIWLGTRFGGLSCYNPSTKSFKNYAEADGLCGTFVWTMIEDNAGKLWIGAAGGGACSFDGKAFTSFSEKDGLGSKHVQSIFQDQKGKLWFGCSGGLYRLDGKAFVNITQTGPWQETSTYDPYTDIVYGGLKDQKGNLWFLVSKKGVYRYNPSDAPKDAAKAGSSAFDAPKAGSNAFVNMTESLGLSKNEVSSIYEDRAGKIWFGLQQSVAYYDGKKLTRISIPQSDADIIYPGSENSKPSPVAIISILQDKSDNYWFGTLGDGVYRYDGTSVDYHLYAEGNVMPDGLHHNVVQSIVEDKAGNLWFASMSRGGVFRYNGQYFMHFTSAEGLSDDRIFALRVDKSGNVWVGTRDHGLCRYDGTKFTNFSTEQGLCNDNISCILEDKAGNLWFGSDIKYGTQPGGLCRYDGKTFKHYTPKEGLMYSGIRTIIEDNAGNLWIGSRGGGLYRYDGKEFADYSAELK